MDEAKQSNAHDFSKESLKAQAAFMMQEGRFRHTRFKYGAIIGGIVILGAFALLGWLCQGGHEHVVEEILKDVVLIIGGGAGGYGIARKTGSSTSRPTSADDQSDSDA